MIVSSVLHMLQIIASVDISTPDIAISHQISALLTLFEEKPLVSIESPHKGAAMWKAFPCHNGISLSTPNLTISDATWRTTLPSCDVHCCHTLQVFCIVTNCSLGGANSSQVAAQVVVGWYQDVSWYIEIDDLLYTVQAGMDNIMSDVFLYTPQRS